MSADRGVTTLNNTAAMALEIAKGFAVLRSFLHVCVRRFVRPRGLVLDLGSGKAPSYLAYLKGYDFHYISADGNASHAPSLVVNLEEGLPIRDESVDCVFLFNVLEHIYRFQHLLDEVRRILKKDGVAFLLVPLLIKVHGSPCDYFRYTHFALRRMLGEAGFEDVKIYATSGVFKLLSLCFNWLSVIKVGYLLYPLFYLLCAMDTALGFLTRGKYTESVPIGYFIRCAKEG